jgi:osmotically-inducible protein OsmY
MPQAHKKDYHHDYYYGPEGMTEHDDWRRAGEDIHNQRISDEPEHKSLEPIHVSDEELRKKVIAALMYDPNIDLNEIEVAVQMGDVKLTGTVASRWMKQKVLADIAEISGVKDIDNQLQVDRPPEREFAQ